MYLLMGKSADLSRRRIKRVASAKLAMRLSRFQTKQYREAVWDFNNVVCVGVNHDELRNVRH